MDELFKGAFDGLGSALVGAFVTAGAVFVTLRHERRAGQSSRLDDESLRLAAVAAELHSLILMSATVPAANQSAIDFLVRQSSWTAECTTLLSALREEEPCFVAIMHAVLERFGANALPTNQGNLENPTGAIANLRSAEKFLRRRVFDPSAMKMDRERCDFVVSQMKLDGITS